MTTTPTETPDERMAEKLSSWLHRLAVTVREGAANVRAHRYGLSTSAAEHLARAHEAAAAVYEAALAGVRP